jgi:hypothetical protein
MPDPETGYSPTRLDGVRSPSPACSGATSCRMMFSHTLKPDTRMSMSTERISVSHVGSLPRSPALSDLLIRQEAGQTIDNAELARQVEIATAHVIGKQAEAGVDVGNDGEQSRVGFQTYVPRCLCGFGGESKRPPSRDQIDFPSYARQRSSVFPTLHGWRTRQRRSPTFSMSTAHRSTKTPRGSSEWAFASAIRA